MILRKEYTWTSGKIEIRDESLDSDYLELDKYCRILNNSIKPFIEMETKAYECGTEDVLQKQFLVQESVGYPSIDSLKAISRYFSVTIDELICSSENRLICNIVFFL